MLPQKFRILLLACFIFGGLLKAASFAATPGVTPDGSGGIIMTKEAAQKELERAVIKSELASRPDWLLQLGITSEISRIAPEFTGQVNAVFKELRESMPIGPNGEIGGYTPSEIYYGIKGVLKTKRVEFLTSFIPAEVTKKLEAADLFLLEPYFGRGVNATDLLADFGSEIGRTFQEQAKSKGASGDLVDKLANSNDPDVRGNFDRFVSGEMGIEQGADLQDLLARNPQLQNDPVFAHVAQAILSGQTNIQLNQQAIAGLFEQQMTGIRGDIGQIAENLAANADAVSDIQKHLRDNSARQQKEAADVAEQRAFDLNLRAAHSGVYLLSSFAQLGGNPKLAHEISVVGGAGIQVADAINSFSKNGLWSAGGAIATGNVIGAVLSVVGLFSAGGPSPEQMILEEIGLLRQELNDFRTEMHDRFDRVDAALSDLATALNTVYSEMQARFDQIDVQLGRINGSLIDIKGSLYDLQGDIHRLERKTFAYLDAVSLRPLVQTISGSIGYESLFGQPMSYSQYLENENVFYSWASFNASDEASSPLVGRSLSDANLFSELSASPFEKNLNYINEFLATRLGQPRLVSGRVANPRDWALAANAYHRLMIENPLHAESVNGSRLDAIIGRGETLATYIDRIARQPSGAANTSLCTALINYYRTQANAVQLAYEGRISDYLVAAGLDASFDPFSVVDANRIVLARETTPNSDPTKLPFGKVETIAASPSTDGLPVYFVQGHAIKRLNADLTVSHVAGSTDSGHVNGSPENARFNGPRGLAIAADGTVFVSDTGNLAIRRIAKNGTVSTLAGIPGSSGGENGLPSTARFRRPWGIAIGSNGDLYVCDIWSHSVRQVKAETGEVSTFVGYAGPDQKGGTTEGIGHAARFYGPHGICVAPDGNFYVTDTWNHTVRKVTPGGVVSTLAGWPTASGLSDSAGPLARFRMPRDVSASPEGYLFVGERGSNLIRRISIATGSVFTPANQTGPAATIGSDSNGDVLSGSTYFACVGSDRSVFTWGKTYNGSDYVNPTVPAGLTNVAEVVTSAADAWAIRFDGSVVAWGKQNTSTSLSGNWVNTTVPAALTSAAKILRHGPGLGPHRGLALRPDGTLFAWGKINDRLENEYINYTPPAISEGAVDIAAGSYHSLALLRSGTIAPWGSVYNGSGYVTATVPSGMTDVLDVSCGAYSSFAVRSNGTVSAWGKTTNNGGSSWVDATVPAGLTDVIAVAASSYHGIALRDDGSVVTWGRINNGSGTYVSAYAPPAGLTDVVAIGTGNFHFSALKADGTQVVWGKRYNGSAFVDAAAPSALGQAPVVSTTAGEQLMAGNALAPAPSALSLGGGTLLVSDSAGMRVAYPSKRKPAYSYAVEGMSQAGALSGSVAKLDGAKALLQQTSLLTYEAALQAGEDLYSLLFTGVGLRDSQLIRETLERRTVEEWWPPQPVFKPGPVSSEVAGLLEAELIKHSNAQAGSGDVVHLDLVSNTLNRLRMARRGHLAPVPLPKLKVISKQQGGLQLTVNGLPFINYGVEVSTDLKIWNPVSETFRDAATSEIGSPASMPGFFRAKVLEP